MKKYSVIKDRNESSVELQSGFETLEQALEFAKIEIMDTVPENDSEGINIYSEEGIEITMSKDGENGYYYTKLNPETLMQVEDTVFVKI